MVFDLPSEKEDEGESDEGTDEGIFNVSEVDIMIRGGGGWISFNDVGEINRKRGGKSEIDGRHVY